MYYHLNINPAGEEKNMSDEINLISEIREAERKAEDMISAARAEGESAIEKIREQYREKTLYAEKEFNSGRNKTIERAKSDAEAEALRLSEETEREIVRMQLHGEKKMHDSAEFLIRNILE